jgi:hypothetical protein
MSVVLLPTGTIVTANLLRPLKDACFMGSAICIAAGGHVTSAIITQGLLHEAASLLNGLPPELVAGPPVSLVLNFITPNGLLANSFFSWLVDQPMTRSDLIERVFGELFACVDAAMDNMQRQMAAAAMEQRANAPASETRQ